MYDEIMSQTMNLLSLAIREPVYPLSINGRTKSMAFTSDEIRIYYPHMHITSEERSIHPLKMLFTYSDISKSIDKYLKNWFLKAKLLEPTFDLYFDTVYSSRLTIQTKFLNMVQALEAYHRRKETMKQSELPKEEHNKRIECIMGAAPAEHKAWLRDKLNFSNEVPLRKRLEEILNIYNETIIDDYLQISGNKEDFIRKVTKYRNTLTHYDPKKKPPKIEDLIDIYPNVKKLVELCLLTEIGFSNKVIIQLLNKDK